MKLHKLKRGFTLVELIIVMVIVGVLAAVVNAKFGDSPDDAKYSKEISTLTSIQGSIEAMNAKSRTFDILSGGVADTIVAKLNKKMDGFTYHITSVTSGNTSAQGIVGFATDDTSKSLLKTIASSLESIYDNTVDANAGKFQYNTTCDTAVTDGTDCNYVLYLDGNILSTGAWEPTIGTGVGELNSGVATSTTSATQTWVKLN